MRRANVLPRIYSHPRCGLHWYSEFLWRNLFSHTLDNRLSLIGGHSLNCEIEDCAVTIKRKPTDVLRSIWNMRQRFGLNNCDTFLSFIETPYVDQFKHSKHTASKIRTNVPGRAEVVTTIDPFFATERLNPVKFLEAYYKRADEIGIPSVKYEFAQTTSGGCHVLEMIASKHDNVFVPAKIDMIDKQVGWNIREDWEKRHV